MAIGKYEQKLIDASLGKMIMSNGSYRIIVEANKYGIIKVSDMIFSIFPYLRDDEYYIKQFDGIVIDDIIDEFEKSDNIITTGNYLKMSYPNKAICMKNPEDEGGISFRVINPDLDMLNILNPNVYENLINYKSVLDVLERSPHFNNFILMPYLDGPEVSVDSIMTKDGRFICVSREKIGTRVARVYYNKELSEISKKFAEVSGITMPYNMQFRKINDKYVLLEVNTRISGGCYKDLYVGVDILGIAFKDVLDLPFIIPDYEGIVEKYISVVETPILLDI